MLIEPSSQFRNDFQKLRKEDVKATFKVMELIFDAMDAMEKYANPLYGRGRPEPLKANLAGCYSREITEKHRLIYKYNEDNSIIQILSCYGHYDD
jgi:toxin YoeB